VNELVVEKNLELGLSIVESGYQHKERKIAKEEVGEAEEVEEVLGEEDDDDDYVDDEEEHEEEHEEENGRQI